MGKRRRRKERRGMDQRRKRKEIKAKRGMGKRKRNWR